MYESRRAFGEAQKNRARKFERLSNADDICIDDGIALLGIAKDLRKMFADADFAGKRNILNHLPSNCTRKGGNVAAAFRKSLI